MTTREPESWQPDPVARQRLAGELARVQWAGPPPSSAPYRPLSDTARSFIAGRMNGFRYRSAYSPATGRDESYDRLTPEQGQDVPYETHCFRPSDGQYMGQLEHFDTTLREEARRRCVLVPLNFAPGLLDDLRRVRWSADGPVRWLAAAEEDAS